MGIELGKYNNLEIIKKVDFGIYLDGGEAGEILMPTKYVPENHKPGDVVKAFIYLDNSERLIATTEKAAAQVGDFAYLEVAWTNKYGAFLSWGVLKDLFVPFREQKTTMEKGKKYLVYIYIDKETYRIVASARIDKFLSNEKPEYKSGDMVEIIIWQKTDLGVKAIVDNKYQGLIYRNETFRTLRAGEKTKAYIKQVRNDGKIDLILQKTGYRYAEDFSEKILEYLKRNNGFLNFNDRSCAEDIYETFGVSKKVFKKAIGHLYKNHQITISEKGIKLKD